MMKKYKAVFLDWDDTIGDFHGAADLALAQMYEKYQLDRYFASLDEFVGLYKPHNQELWAKYGEDKVTKEYLSLDRFLFPLMHGSLYPNGETAQVIRLAMTMSDDFLALTTAHFSLLPGAEEIVRYLAEKYPLTIVTNGFVEVQYEKFDKSGLKDCFSHIVLSEEVGCQKPNPRIFEEALRLNGLSADEVVMVGDSWYSDIQGAINAGIDQIWVTDHLSDDCAPTYTVKSLEEIKSIL